MDDRSKWKTPKSRKENNWWGRSGRGMGQSQAAVELTRPTRIRKNPNMQTTLSCIIEVDLVFRPAFSFFLRKSELALTVFHEYGFYSRCFVQTSWVSFQKHYIKSSPPLQQDEIAMGSWRFQKVQCSKYKWKFCENTYIL